MILPHSNNPKLSETPRIGNGDVHFHRTKHDLDKELATNKTYDNRNQSPLDKFGKKMMPPEKANINFGHKQDTDPVLISPGRGSEKGSNKSPGKSSNFKQISPHKPSTSLDIKSHSPSQKSGLYHKRYYKYGHDVSKAGEAQPDQDTNHFR